MSPIFRPLAPFAGDRRSSVRQRILAALCAALLAIAAWFAPAGGAIAAAPGLLRSEDPSVDSPAVPSLDTSTISSEKVSQFATAYAGILDLRDRYRPQADSTADDMEALRLRREFETAARDIIERAGLQLHEYEQLAGLANADPEFGERVALQMREIEL